MIRSYSYGKFPNVQDEVFEVLCLDKGSVVDPSKFVWHVSSYSLYVASSVGGFEVNRKVLAKVITLETEDVLRTIFLEEEKLDSFIARQIVNPVTFLRYK